MNERIKKFFKFNMLVFIYSICAILMELISICFTDCKPYLTKPVYPLVLFSLILLILFLFKSVKTKVTICSILLFAQVVLNVGLVYLYDSNGTYFEWAMINQRNDAFGTIEDLSLRWSLLTILMTIFVIYLIGSILTIKFFYKKDTKHKTYKLTKIIISSLLAICSIFIVLNPTISAIQSSKQSYVDRFLYSDATSKYQQLGISSNAIYETINGTIVDNLVKHDNKGIEKFIYEDENALLATSPYFGISKDNNLIYILVESFEWYVFLENCTPEQSQILYPNLNKFFSDSIYADNFYAREKTDTSEMLALLGSNPTGKYTNYDFPNNSFDWSLPNLFKEHVKNNGKDLVQIKSFHQNNGDFYNRNTLHENLGFEQLIDIEEMKEFGLVDTWKGNREKGQRTLDSETMLKMKDEMFPDTDSTNQYMTFWLTFSMHGHYKDRKILKPYYDKLDSVGAYPEGKGTKGDYLRTYAATVMDFDKALGIMMEKLEQNGDLENTTIVMFADHNTYYNNLSYYAKDIDERYNSELYRVPFMIYDQKLKTQYELNEGTNKISKFTTTSDMLPTILDIFGINGYKNLYYGTSMFVKNVESVIFSRAYGIFVTDKLICFGANDLLYKSSDFTKDDYESFLSRAETLLTKQEYLDKIYYNDYFKNHPLRKIS